MLKIRAALCHHQIIISVMIKNIRTFCGSDLASFKHIVNRPCQLLSLFIIFLNQNSPKPFFVQPVIQHHVYQPFSPVHIMKQRRIKPSFAKRNRFRPGTFYIRGSHHKVMGILVTAPIGVHNRIKQVKNPLVIGQIWRPDSTGRIHSFNIKFRLVSQNIRDNLPVHQIPGVVNTHSWKPLECRGGNIIILSCFDKRRIWIKSRKNRIFYFHNNTLLISYLSFQTTGGNSLYKIPLSCKE